MLSRKVQVLQETVRKLIGLEASHHLRNVLDKSMPADIAYCMRHFNLSEQEKILHTIVDLSKRAAVVAEMDADLSKKLLVRLGTAETAQLLPYLFPDDAADQLERLPEDFRQAVLPLLKPERSEEVQELILHRPESAGGIMSPEIFAVEEECTVQEAIRLLQSSRSVENIFY